MKLAFHGSVVEQQGVHTVALDNRLGFLRALGEHLGKRVTITVQRYRKPRSDNQNRYYWGVVLKMIAADTGSEPEEVHDAMKLRFLLVSKGRLGVTLKSTTDLSTVEFEEYLEKVRAYAAMELRITIPLPNEVAMDELDEVAA